MGRFQYDHPMSKAPWRAHAWGDDQDRHDDDPACQDIDESQSVDSDDGSRARWIVDSGTTFHIVSGRGAERAGMTRIPVPKKVSFSTANGTTYSTHYANFVLPGTNISLSAYILEESRMLLSVCQLCLHEGLGFLNVPGKTPVLILPDGGRH